jgi:hypothetical protein
VHCGRLAHARSFRDHRRTAGFLKTGTGAITAVATVGVAIAAVTWLTGRENTPAERLWSHIPAELRSTCARSTSGEPGAISAYNCTHRHVIGLQYDLFSSTSELAAAYEAVKRQYLPNGAGAKACSDGGFDGAYEPGGSLLCFVDEHGGASIVWSDVELDILSFAWRTDDGTLRALYDAWQEGVGPER